MKDTHFDQDLDRLIRDAIKLEAQPAPELNHMVKTALYQQEAAASQTPPVRTVSLWFLPMILNLIASLMLAAAALILISNSYLSYFTAGVFWYIGAAGVLLTIVGMKRTNLRENTTIQIQKGGKTA